MGRIASVQILRLVAAVMVVLVHAAQWRPGFAGVDIFFVISGFVIATILPRSTLSGFVRSRLTRIFPIYWLCLCLRAPEIIAHDGWSIERAATSLTLWPVWGDFAFPYLFVGWSLCFELLFYAAAALTLLDKRAKPLLLVGYVVALAGAFVLGWPLLRFIGNPIILEFLAGVLLAQLPRTENRVAGGLAIVAGAALILAVPVAGIPEQLIDLTDAKRAILFGAPAFAIVWGAMRFESSLRGKVADALSYGGDASYAIYLTHTIILWHLLIFVPWWVAVPWVILVGVGVHRYVEAPLLRRLRRYSIISIANQDVELEMSIDVSVSTCRESSK